MWKKMKWYVISAALGFMLAAACALFTYTGVFEQIDNLLYDAIYQQFYYSSEDVPIRIIAIDEKTEQELGDFEAWSRAVSADLVTMLNSGEEKPVIIGMDLLYSESRDLVGDTAFVNACKKAANVCLIARMEEKKNEDVLETQEISGNMKNMPLQVEQEIVYPYEKIRNVVQLGIANSFEEQTKDVVREFALDTRVGQEKVDSFALVLYKAYQKHSGKEYQTDSINRENEVRFNYSRQSGEYKTYSFIDVLNGKIDLSEFANTIVIVGDYTEKTRHIVPSQQGGQMQDAGLQANMVEAMLSKKIIHKFPNQILAIVYGCFIFGGYSFVFLIRERRKKSIPRVIFMLFIHFQVSYFLASRNYYLPLLPLWIFFSLAGVLGLFIGYLREKEKKQNLQKALAAYVESDIVEQILENNDFDIKLGNEKREIAVLFVDIRGFTTISEKLPPEEIVLILNSYLELVARAVMKNEGNIDKFIGDAAMALYNAPKDLEDYVLKAVYTAWDILKGAESLKQECLEKFGKEISFGIGINCGPAVVGNIGCECRMDYTAIGDTVNTASRLESNAKAGQILISSKVYEAVKDFVKVRPMGNLTLKGKSNTIETYEITGIIRKGASGS